MILGCVGVALGLVGVVATFSECALKRGYPTFDDGQRIREVGAALRIFMANEFQ